MRNPPSQEIKVATFGTRALAFLIDQVILALLGLVVGGTLGSVGASVVLLLVAALGVEAAYRIGFVIATSTTPGKRAMGLYIATKDGKTVLPDTAILRYLVYLIGNIVVVGLLISIFLAIVDKRRRTLHDRIAGTLVLVGPPPAAEGFWR